MTTHTHKLSKVTRFEVIEEGFGRFLVRNLVEVELSYQDCGRTLKVFVKPRGRFKKKL